MPAEPARAASRYTRARPCRICGGWESMPRGQGTRCDGYEFGQGAYCARRTNGKRHPSANLWWHPLGGAAGEPARQSAPAPRARIVASYDYRDETGAVVFQVVRFEPKGFKQRRPDGRGGWTWGLGDAKPCLYRLPELIAAAGAGDTVYVVEGEKDADAMHAAGAVATCNPMGAGKWRDEYAQHFAGAADVRIIADRDEPGRRHAAQVAASLRRVGIVPRVFEAAEGKDAADHLAAGLSLEGLREIALDEPGAAIGAGGDAWPEPRPLPPKTPAAPAMPEDLLPEALRPWIVDAAERICLPLEYVAMPALVALGSVVGRALGICPKQRDTGWRVVPNLWGAIVGPPGRMKSAAVAEALAPLSPLIARAAEEFARERVEIDAHRAAIEVQIKALKAGKRGGKRDAREAGEIGREIAEFEKELRETVAAERRYKTSDATAEKLGELLRDNPRGLLLERDELTGWLAGLDRKGREGERAFFLEAWEGTGGFDFDRIGRGTVRVPALCLSVFGGIQPGPLAAYLDEALGEGGGADGLLQRFQLVAWPDDVPPYQNIDRAPDAAARARVQHVFDTLAALKGPQIRSAAAEPEEIPCVHFAPDAQELFDAWRHDLERRLRSRSLEATPAFASHLGKYRSLMPTLALLFALADAAERGFVGFGGVALAHAQHAAALCEYLEQHARKLYAVEIDGAAMAAHALADRIRRGLLADGMTLRDVQRAGWRGLTGEGAVQDGLELLERSGWLRVERREAGPEGGRPSAVVRLSPRLGEEA